MATSFPTYPATTFEQAVELAIFSSNQLHNIINADPLSTVETEDGDIPSVRKALIDNLYFITPAITWAEGTSVTVFNQLYKFSGGTTGTALWYAPTATTTNPITMGSSPEDDANWKIYGWDTYSKSELNSTSGAGYIGTTSGNTVEAELESHSDSISGLQTNVTSLESNITSIESSSGFSMIGQVSSFANLRLLTPSSAGQRVLLAAWNESVTPYGQASFGGGEFIAVSGSATDDGGFVAKVSDDWYWQRIKSVTEATILDFGALPDGTTLCDTALINMFVWAYGSTAQSNVDTLETTVKENQGIVRFGPGQFAIGNVDLTSYGRKNGVKFYGDLTGDYKNLKTTLYLTAGSGFAVTAYFLQCEMAGFNIIGQYETNTGDTCGFLDNQYAGAPQQFRARAFHIQYAGGKIFNLTDTMDTEITQIYMENGTSTLVYNKWSGNTSGEWDHTTAVALRDISIWNIKTNSVLFIPRCHQSEICNVWISGCDKPGNISQGDWKFSGVLQLEGNAEDFYAQEAHLVGFEPGTQGSYGISYTEGSSEIPSSWDDNSMGVPDYVTQPQWERGRTFITPTGLEVYYGSVQTNYYASRNVIRHNGSDSLWYYLGDLYLPDTGQSCDITILGTGGYNSAEGTLEHTYDSGFGGGKAIISVQNKGSGKVSASWYSLGSSAVSAVQTTGDSQYLSVYVQIKSYSPSQSVFVSTDAPARTDAGLHFLWTYNGKTIDMSTVTSTLTTAPSRWMVSNGTATGGFGVDMDNGSLVMGVNLQTMNSTTLNSQGIPVYINGALFYIPLIPS